MKPRPLRPQAIGEIVDAGLGLCRDNLRTLVLTALVFVLPAQVVMNGMIAAFGVRGAGIEATGGVHVVGATWRTYVGTLGAAVAIAILQAVFATAACSYVALLAYVDCERVPARDALGVTLRRAHSLLWIAIRLALSVFVLALLLVASVFLLSPLLPLGLAWVLVQFVLLVPVMLVEQTRGRKAIKRVRHLLSGRVWRSLTVVLVAAIPVVLVEVISGAVLFGLTHLTGRNDAVGAVAATVLGTVVGILAFPLVAATAAVLYVDLRIRAEGLDVELAAERLGLEPARRLLRPAPPAAALVFPGGSTPPYWPPPPGWTPQEPAVPLRVPEVNPNLPPYWPPPPGWTPPAPDGS